MKFLKAQKGLSLVEVTIMLLVLMLLTSVLAPSIFDFIKDAARVKVKEDCEAIGLSIARLYRDVNCIAFAGQGRPVDCQMDNIVGLLYSDGAVPESVGGLQFTPGSSVADCRDYYWDPTNPATQRCADTLEHQLVTNNPHYDTPVDLGWEQNPLPLFNTGWRGAYVAPPVGPDPWGNMYMVNSLFLRTALDARGGPYGSPCSGTPSEGQGCWGWSFDTFCISAGENGVVETPFAASNSGTERAGDDFVYVISGGSR
ncbi:MAG: type II secretion system protein [Acidobacteriota bacterium]